jgi:hypothetical protein
MKKALGFSIASKKPSFVQGCEKQDFSIAATKATSPSSIALINIA